VHLTANPIVLQLCSPSESSPVTQKFLATLAVSVLLSAPASAAVVLGGPVDLSSGTPFTFGPSPTVNFL